MLNKPSMIKRFNISRPFKPLQKNNPDLSLIYWSCHSKKTINRPLISLKSSAGPSPDAGVPPDRHLTPQFRRTDTCCRSSAGPPPDARVPPDHRSTPELQPTAD
ncbi:hypothetical protein M5K25_003033 [Dendrobium thyrsiflorum]|uniref:Uncharacterized protein n=1 Tax=Dendrobium thyrsiflorum TaxID=117978 RepID=A0ABD0VQ50_DENTH